DRADSMRMTLVVFCATSFFITATPATITTPNPNSQVGKIARKTACLCTSGVTMHTTSDMDTKQQGLEPCEGRLSCTVLRGLGYGNIPWLPGASGNGSCLAFGAQSRQQDQAVFL